MGSSLIGFKFELCLCDLSVTVAVLVGEHVVNDAVRIKAGSQATFTLGHLPHDVVSELCKQKGDGKLTVTVKRKS